MNRTSYLASLGIVALLTSCATGLNNSGAGTASAMADDANWMNMSGSFNGWNQVGDANWRIIDGEFIADSGNGHLVTEDSYEDFQIQLQFWASEGSNSGIFVRASNPQQIADSNAYEINIYDTRPDQTYRTGGIVNFAPPVVQINTPGRWNTYDITLEDNVFKVMLNGITTVVFEDEANTYTSGPITLQYGSGLVKFRNVRIREL